MGEKIVIGPIDKGIRTDRTAFNIDNDSFPTLVNAYQWRGRVKRKRGTSFLTRFQRFLGTTDASGNFSVTIVPISLNTGVSVFNIGSDVFTDPGGSSPVNLITNGSGSGTLNRTTGALSITGSIALTAVNYYPGLSVMGLEDFYVSSNAFLTTIGFDTRYSYNLTTTSPYTSYSVSFYKNPPSSTYTGYTAKTTWTPVNWSGESYRQFWTTNYQGSMWTTNGISIPFISASSNIGMQFKAITVVDNITTGPPAFADITFGSAHGLVIGDFLFINEVATTTGINFQTGYVTAVVSPTKVTVEFPNATINTAGTGGIAQYLNSSLAVPTKDCLRWYDGDPTDGTPPTPTSSMGWVNFCPPLSQADFSIGDLPKNQYYLVGARAVLPFKDRLVFFGVVVQASDGSPIYLQDTIVYSQNGTPYYTSSYTNTPSATVDTPTSATNVFNPILVPLNQIATSPAYFADQTGFGGFQTLGVDQPINTVATNEDVLILGLDFIQTRMTYTGNDIVPFNFYIVNSELGSSSTFSAVNMDKGVISRGSRGFVITSQTGTQRIDLQIPDTVFEINLPNNGRERVCAQRDFINEWIYFSYPNNADPYVFPNQTLQFNYRDDSWGIFYESYTTYGSFRKQTGDTWATIGGVFKTWNSWSEPWNAGDSSTLLQAQVIAGNPQGFVLTRDEGTSEGNSGFISNISGSTVTSPNHMLQNGTYIVISGALGTVASQVNGNIFSVQAATTDTFNLNPSITGGTYLGSGLIQRMYVPLIQTKQFPVAWDMARKTRIGPQQYLFSITDNGQVTLLISLSQDADNAYNTMLSTNPVIPSVPGINVNGVTNSGTIYSTVLYTCPESTNLGLTFSTSNLNTPTASSQAQIWHRNNTSLIGDTIQIGFTLSDAQMRDTLFRNQFVEIEFHSAILDVQPSQLLV